MLYPGPFVGCCAAGMLSHDGRCGHPWRVMVGRFVTLEDGHQNQLVISTLL